MWKAVIVVMMWAGAEARLNETCTAVTETGVALEGFRCLDGQCVHEWHVCDEFQQCQDGSDEDGCPVWRAVLPAGALCVIARRKKGLGMDCGDGKCIRMWRVCDGRLDCEDGRDEKACVLRTNPASECQTEAGELGRRCGHQCPSCRCVPLAWFCNGVRDCNDNSDEQHCAYNATIARPPSATP